MVARRIRPAQDALRCRGPGPWGLARGGPAAAGLCGGPGPVLEGESEVEESFEVDSGCSGGPPGVVLDHAPVGDAAGVACHPGDGPFDHRPVLAIDSLEVWILRAGAVYSFDLVVDADHHLAASRRLGAPACQGACRAYGPERDAALRGDLPGLPGRTRHDPALMDDGEVINRETTGNGTVDRHRFDSRPVSCCPDRSEHFA